VRAIHFIVITFAVSTVAWAQVPNDLSLSEAVAAALESQPLMRSAQLGLELAEERVAAARRERLPAVRITETITRGNNPVFVFGSLLEQARFGPENFFLPALNNPSPITNVRTAVSANIPLFDRRKTSTHIEQASITRDQAVLGRTMTEQRTRFDVIRAYLGVLVALASRDTAGEAVRMGESDLERTADRIEAGLAVESDRLAAQVQLAEFTRQKIDAEGNLATAFVTLNVAMGSPPETRRNLTVALMKKTLMLPEPEELVRRAMTSRPDYALANFAIEFAGRQIAERRGDYLPELNLFGTFGASGRNWGAGSTDYSLGAGLALNLFDPNRASRVTQAGIQQNLARMERDRVRDQIIVEVARAYHQYRASIQQLEVAEAALSQAAEALRIIQDRYETGLTTITDLLRAETAFVRARMNLTSATEAQYLGYANVLLVIGELTDVQAFES
jgi:outer membrane protein TolC